MTWVEGSVIGVRDDNAKEVNQAIFLNTVHTGNPPADTWHEVDVTQFGVPPDAKSIFLSGILIITHGTKSEIGDLAFYARAPGTADCGKVGQTCEACTGGGQRSNAAFWVPVKDGKFEWKWTRSTDGKYPESCSYGINLSLQAYVR